MLFALFCIGAAVGTVRLDDALHEFMADHVAIREVREIDPIDPAQRRERLDEAAALVAGQIDLRRVAGDHRLAIRTEPREKHEHLFRGGILRFVKDDERVIQGTASHVGERRDFDHTTLEIPLHLLRLHHVVQRIVERT